MNNDIYSREFSIGSDRELDNLALIKNLDASQSELELKKAKESVTMAEFIYDEHGNGKSPRRGHQWTSEFGSVAEQLEHKVTEHTDTPVRKLKQKNDSIGPVEREYSDAYLEGNLRTPRYNTHTSYEGMLENLDPTDPFDGDYKPSGKPKHEKSRKSKKDKSPDARSKIPIAEKDVKDTHAKSRKSKKKKRKEQDSMESTGTYTLEGQTNMSYKGTEMDMASVKSNGTYTVPELRKSPRTTSRMSSHFTRSRKSRHNRIGVDRVNIIFLYFLQLSIKIFMVFNSIN